MLSVFLNVLRLDKLKYVYMLANYVKAFSEISFPALVVPFLIVGHNLGKFSCSYDNFLCSNILYALRPYKSNFPQRKFRVQHGLHTKSQLEGNLVFVVVKIILYRIHLLERCCSARGIPST